jgi:hypothetical protein
MDTRRAGAEAMGISPQGEQPQGKLPEDNPYVGPRAYTEAEAPRFYGRERESRDLLALVVRERLVLFYAQSGAGKSSLLHARLIPGLRQEGFDVLPVARVSGELPVGGSRTEIHNVYVYNLILSLNQGLPEADQVAASSLRNTSLLTYLTGEQPSTSPEEQAPLSTPQGAAVPAPKMAPTVLIVDQFEEILTIHPERWRERRGLFEQLRDALERVPNLWLVLTLREDYVAPLEIYAELLPNRLRARFYMQRMMLEGALQAIEEPASSYGRPFAPGVAQTLVDNLSRVRVPGEAEPQPGPYVEPVQLQVVCYQLWENMRSKPPGPITEGDLPLGYIDQALTRFYEDRLAEALADPAAQRAGVTERGLRNWFSNELITAGGIRDTVLRNEGTGRTGSVPNAAVDPLARKYLVRMEPRAGGIWVELVHDRFVAPILESNTTWSDRNSDPLTQAAQAWQDAGRDPAKLFMGSQLAAAAARLQARPHELGGLEREFVEEARKTETTRTVRRQRRVTLAVGALAVVFALLTAFALWSAIRASRAQNRAEASLRVAAADRDTAATLAANLAAVLTAQVGGELPPPLPGPTESGTSTVTQPPSRTPAPYGSISPPIVRPATTRAPTLNPYPYQQSTISAVQEQLYMAQARQTVASMGVTLYIQIPSDASRDQALRLEEHLKQKGYVIARIDEVGPKASPASPEIRYYDAGQERAAAMVQRDLASFGLGDFILRLVTGYGARSAGDVVEICFPQ